MADAPPQGPGVVVGGHPCGRATPSACAAGGPWKWPDLPSSRRTLCRHAHAPSTPEEPGAACLDAASDAATAKGTTGTSSTGLSRLNRMARRLAVYASHRAVTDRHARLACGCWLSSAARDSHPPGPTERFQLCVRFTYHPPLASLLGAIPFSSAERSKDRACAWYRLRRR